MVRSCLYYMLAVLRIREMFIPDPDFFPSRILDPTTTTKFIVLPFFVAIICKLFVLNRYKLSQLTKILRIRDLERTDPGPRIQIQGAKKAPDPGFWFATLHAYCTEAFQLFPWRLNKKLEIPCLGKSAAFLSFNVWPGEYYNGLNTFILYTFIVFRLTEFFSKCCNNQEGMGAYLKNNVEISTY
jgi:hypothetical protein